MRKEETFLLRSLPMLIVASTIASLIASFQPCSSLPFPLPVSAPCLSVPPACQCPLPVSAPCLSVPPACPSPLPVSALLPVIEHTQSYLDIIL